MLLQAASSASVGLQQLACDHQSLDLTGPLVDLGDPSVAVVAFRWHLRHVAHPTQDLDSLKHSSLERNWGQEISCLQNAHTHKAMLRGTEPTPSIMGRVGHMGMTAASL